MLHMKNKLPLKKYCAVFYYHRYIKMLLNTKYRIYPSIVRRTLPTSFQTEIDWCVLYTGAYYTIAVLEVVGRVRTIQLAFQLGWLVVINFFFSRFTRNSFSVDFESFTPAAHIFWLLHI